jgi:hypothetical protein
MIEPTIPDFPSSLALELFHPEPNVFYSLNEVERLHAKLRFFRSD